MICPDCNGRMSEGAIRCGDCQMIWDGPEGAKPGDTCVTCHEPFGEDGRREVPYAMDVWEHDVPILGVKAGEPVAFCLVVCSDCAAEHASL